MKKLNISRHPAVDMSKVQNSTTPLIETVLVARTPEFRCMLVNSAVFKVHELLTHKNISPLMTILSLKPGQCDG